MKLTPDDIRAQSERAYSQWATTWRENAKTHSKYPMRKLTDFEHIGIGKAVVCVANGYSLELEIETLKKYQGQVDILCCDKSLGHLLDNGITPTFCIVCDAKVSYEKYMEPWKDKLGDIVLFENVCGNTEWSEKGNWKERYFFANMDVLQSEKEFMALSGCPNQVTAGTNVSNALVVFLTQSDNTGRKNFFGYDKILLVGFDYAWREDGNYYAFDKSGGGKHNYMRHIFSRNIDNRHCYTSNNLAFSAKWLEQYIAAFRLPVVQCSRESVLPMKNMGVLAEQMQYSFKKEHRKVVKDLLAARNKALQEKARIEKTLTEIGREHYYSFICSV